VVAQRSCEARRLDGIGMGVFLSKSDQINMCGLYCGRGRDVVILTRCKGGNERAQAHFIRKGNECLLTHTTHYYNYHYN